MPQLRCVECGAPVDELFKEYSKGNICLTKCGGCGALADKYIECDMVLISIDMVLQLPQVYRHVLFNRLKLDADSGAWNRTIARLAVLLVLFDTYIKWFRVERQFPGEAYPLRDWSIATQYAYFFCIAVAESALQNYVVHRSLGRGTLAATWQVLTVASLARFCYLLMIVWNYDARLYGALLHAFVLAGEARALSVFYYGGGRVPAAMRCAAAGLVAKAVLQLLLLLHGVHQIAF